MCQVLPKPEWEFHGPLGILPNCEGVRPFGCGLGVVGLPKTPEEDRPFRGFGKPGVLDDRAVAQAIHVWQ